MATSPGRSNNPSVNSYVLSASSSQDFLDESVIEKLAGQIAVDPDALSLHCLSNSSPDADDISTWLTQPMQIEEAPERQIPETPQATDSAWLTAGDIYTATTFQKGYHMSHRVEASPNRLHVNSSSQMGVNDDGFLARHGEQLFSHSASVAQAQEENIPTPRLDLFDRLKKALPDTITCDTSNEEPTLISNPFASRSFRKRREIQLHPFTIEKLHYKAQVGHAHDSHLSQAEIQKRRAIREKYVTQDDDLLARAAEAKKAKLNQNAQCHNRQNAIEQRKLNRPVVHQQSSTTVWQSQRKRMVATYGKNRTAMNSTPHTPEKKNDASALESNSQTIDKSSRRTMQQQLDLLFPEFSFDNSEKDDQYTHQKKRRRVIQDESDTDSDNDSVQYLGETKETEPTESVDDDIETPNPSNAGTKRANRLDKLKQKRALKGILPMSFTKVFSKELTEDQKTLESRRAAQRQNRRKRMESGSLAKEVNELSISSDRESAGTSNENVHTSDIFTDEEGDGENNDDIVWSLDDWLGQETSDVEMQEDLPHTVLEATAYRPVVLRDKDPIDRMIIRSPNTKQSSKASRTTTATTPNSKKVSKYNYNRSGLTRTVRGTKKSAKKRATPGSSRAVSKQSSGYRSNGHSQQHIWRFMDIRKTRPHPLPTPNPESGLEAEDQFFKQMSNDNKDLPAWVQTLLQARNNMKKPDKDRARASRSIIPPGIGPFYRSISDVTSVNWWQRHGQRRPKKDALENTEPTKIDHNQSQVQESLLSGPHDDVQVINPRVIPSKQSVSKRTMRGTKQSRLFDDHGFSRETGPSNQRNESLTFAANNTEPIHIVKLRHKERKAASNRDPSQSQFSFIQFLNDSRDFPTTYSLRGSGIDWQLPSNGYISQGFLKNLEDSSFSSETILKYADMATNYSIFTVFGVSFDINGLSLQQLEDYISSFFLEAMKSVQDMVFERSVVDSNAFHQELSNFFSCITRWLCHWIPLLEVPERQFCLNFICMEIMSFQKRLMKLTNIQVILISRDPAASVTLEVVQVLLTWFTYSIDWEHRIQRLESATQLHLPFQLDLMLALLLWLGPDRLSSNGLFGQLILETWICYLHSLSRSKPLRDQLSYIVEHVRKVCVADGLDSWKTGEMIWQWLYILADILHYDTQLLQSDPINADHLWFAIHHMLQDNALLTGQDDMAYNNISQHMNMATKEFMDDYIRALFSRVHQLCRHYPSSAIHDTLLILQSFYLDRRFQDLATERDSSFPGFFIDFIGHIPQEIASQDTCFHIFLKTLCISLQNEQELLSGDTDKERKQLRRFLSQLAPTHVMTIRKDDPQSGKYSALGNHFNLNMLFAHVVSTDIQRRSILQAKSFLNFHDSDHIARKMYFEAFTLLSRIYAFHEDRQGLNSIVKLLNERLGYVCDEFARMHSRQSMTKHGFFTAADLQADQTERQELIESGFIYIWKIVRDTVSMVDDTAEWFEVAVLSIDKAWSCVLDKQKPFPANTRLYAVNFIRSILTVREQRVARLKDQNLHKGIGEASHSSSLRSGDSQDFDMFDDFDYEALDMQIEKVYYDEADRLLAQSIKSWVVQALQQLQPHISSDSELQETINLAISESLRLLTDHHM